MARGRGGGEAHGGASKEHPLRKAPSHDQETRWLDGELAPKTSEVSPRAPSPEAPIWEISLTAQAGELAIPANAEFLEGHFRRLGISGYLPVELSHVYRAAALLAIHQDPFDRILVAQALVENLTLVSRDRVLAEYPVQLIWWGAVRGLVRS